MSNPDLSEKLTARLDQYHSRTAPFFELLSTGGPLNKAQFQRLRVNYFYRIATTPAFIARVVLRALEERQLEIAAAILEGNLCDELGDFARGDVHMSLLTYCFNHVGRLRFRLTPLEPVDAENSTELLPAARAYRQTLHALACHPSFARISGASYAQEYVAHQTLQQLHRHAISPLMPKRWPLKRVPLDRYFTVHIGNGQGDDLGSEIEHRRVAFEALERLCSSPEAVNEAVVGADLFLAAQEVLFGELKQQLEQVRTSS